MLLCPLGIVVVVGTVIVWAAHSVTLSVPPAWALIDVGGAGALVCTVWYGTRYGPFPVPQVAQLSEREWALRKARAELGDIQRAAGLIEGEMA